MASCLLHLVCFPAIQPGLTPIRKKHLSFHAVANEQVPPSTMGNSQKSCYLVSKPMNNQLSIADGRTDLQTLTGHSPTQRNQCGFERDKLLVQALSPGENWPQQLPSLRPKPVFLSFPLVFAAPLPQAPQPCPCVIANTEQGTGLCTVPHWKRSGCVRKSTILPSVIDYPVIRSVCIHKKYTHLYKHPVSVSPINESISLSQD